MVCPLRFVLAAASALLVAGTLYYYAFGIGEEPAFLSAQRHARRSWWRFFAAFFTGELLYEAWNGAPADNGAAAAVAALASAEAEAEAAGGAAAAAAGAAEAAAAAEAAEAAQAPAAPCEGAAAIESLAALSNDGVGSMRRRA